MNRTREATEQHVSDYWFETQSRDQTSPLMNGITKESRVDSDNEDILSLEQRRSIIEGTFGLNSNDKFDSIFRNSNLGEEDLTYSGGRDDIRSGQETSMSCETDFNINSINIADSEDFGLTLQDFVCPVELDPPCPPPKHYVEDTDNGSVLSTKNPPPQNFSGKDDARNNGDNHESENTATYWMGTNVITSNEPQAIITNTNSISSGDQGNGILSSPQGTNLSSTQPVNVKVSAIESILDRPRLVEPSPNDQQGSILSEVNTTVQETKSPGCKMSATSLSETLLESKNLEHLHRQLMYKHHTLISASSTSQTSSNQKAQKKENDGIDIKNEKEQHSKLLIKSNASSEPIEHRALLSPRMGTWEKRYAGLKLFKAEHGHCNVQCSSEEYRELQTWVYNQRRRRSQLSRSKVQLLDDIGFQWKARNVVGWQTRYEQLQLWIETNGHNIKPDDKGLCEWIAKQRRLYALKNQGRKSQLSAEREAKLNHLAFVWSPSQEAKVRNDKIWERNFQMLKEFKEQHGHCRVPRGHKFIGLWVMNQRMELKLSDKGQTSSINKKRKLQLESINFS